MVQHPGCRLKFGNYPLTTRKRQGKLAPAVTGKPRGEEGHAAQDARNANATQNPIKGHVDRYSREYNPTTVTAIPLEKYEAREQLADPVAEFTATVQRQSAILREHEESSTVILSAVRNDWFRMDLEWRVRINAASKQYEENRKVIEGNPQYWQSLELVNPDILRVFQKDWERWSQITKSVRAAVKEKLEEEQRTIEAIKASPEAEALFRDGDEDGKKAYAEGDYDVYDLDELEQQFGL